MWGWNRPRRNIPEVNYNESSEDDYDSPITSPSRPPNTRAGSPVQLAVPTLCDNVDEELEQVNQTLINIGHTHTFRNTRPVGAPETVEGHIVGIANEVALEHQPPPAIMVVNYDQQNEADDANAISNARY